MFTLNEFISEVGALLQWEEGTTNAALTALNNQGKVENEALANALKQGLQTLTTPAKVQADILHGKLPEEFNNPIAKFYTGSTLSGVEKAGSASVLSHLGEYVDKSAVENIYKNKELKASQKYEAVMALVGKSVNERLSRVSTSTSDEWEKKLSEAETNFAQQLGEKEQTFSSEIEGLKTQSLQYATALKSVAVTSELAKMADSIMGNPETLAKIVLSSNAGYAFNTNDKAQIIATNQDGKEVPLAEAVKSTVEAEGLVRANQAGQDRQADNINPLGGQQPGGGENAANPLLSDSRGFND